jgi:hypothetical protein
MCTPKGSRPGDLQHILIDSTITRANACAAGPSGNHAKAKALERSKEVIRPRFMPLPMPQSVGFYFDRGSGKRHRIGVSVVEAIRMQPVIPPRSNLVSVIGLFKGFIRFISALIWLS